MQLVPGDFEEMAVPILAGWDFTDPNDTQFVQHGEKAGQYGASGGAGKREIRETISSGQPGNVPGRHVGFGIDSTTKMDMEIVGVFKDIKYTNLRDEIPIQMCTPYLASNFVGGMIDGRPEPACRPISSLGQFAGRSIRSTCESAAIRACARWASRFRNRCWWSA